MRCEPRDLCGRGINEDDIRSTHIRLVKIPRLHTDPVTDSIIQNFQPAESALGGTDLDSHRLRPKLLTEGTAIIGLAPMLWASGTGAEVIAPMAATLGSTDGWQLLAFLESPHPALDGQSPRTALEQGTAAQRVIDLATAEGH